MILLAAFALAHTSAINVTPTLGFADASTCMLQPTGEKLITAMDAAKRNGRVGVLNGRAISTHIVDRGRRSDTDRTSEVILPAGATLNGLPVVSISSGYYQKAESDSYQSRNIVFDASPARVHAMMAKLGAKVPHTPGFLAIPDTDDVRPGAITIKPKGHRTILTCGWGL